VDELGAALADGLAGALLDKPVEGLLDGSVGAAARGAGFASQPVTRRATASATAAVARIPAMLTHTLSLP
jgi:hypothetical protein